MATNSILRNIIIDNNAAKKFAEVLERESPVKDIKPVSLDELKRSEEVAKAWLSKRSQ